MNREESQIQLAVLIDGDNAQPAITKELFAEIARYGIAAVRRIYGDWASSNLNGWKNVLLNYALTPVQQFRYTSGKNATDSAMIIDAMDLLYTKNFDGFCIVSSDSDFTRLALRIRESGLVVYGFGERKTPKPFVSACNKFIFTEILAQKFTDETAPLIEETQSKSKIDGTLDLELLTIIKSVIEENSDEEGWVNQGEVYSRVRNQTPEFDYRNYGFKKFGQLIAATGLCTIEKRPNPKTPSGFDYYVRLK